MRNVSYFTDEELRELNYRTMLDVLGRYEYDAHTLIGIAFGTYPPKATTEMRSKARQLVDLLPNGWAIVVPNGFDPRVTASIEIDGVPTTACALLVVDMLLNAGPQIMAEGIMHSMYFYAARSHASALLGQANG